MAKGFLTIPIGYKRIDNEPLEYNTLFPSLELANSYVANNPTAYRGQIISVINGEKTEVYQIGESNELLLVSTEYDRYVINSLVGPYRISHSYKGYPPIKVLSQDGSDVTTEVKYIDDSTIEVNWNGNFSGFIILG